MGPGVATPLPLVQHMHSQKTIFDSCPTDPRVLFSCHVWDPFLHKRILNYLSQCKSLPSEYAQNARERLTTT